MRSIKKDSKGGEVFKFVILCQESQEKYLKFERCVKKIDIRT